MDIMKIFAMVNTGLIIKILRIFVVALSIVIIVELLCMVVRIIFGKVVA
tara:strand:- start:1023 stop:1169 length:147 start_codon:yes stop_codon:yes gene_type:complete